MTRLWLCLRFPFVALFCAFIFSSPGPTLATTMVELGLSDLCWIADIVAEAEVVHRAAERSDGGLYIKSVSTLRLTRVLKGDFIEGDTVSVREWGGKLDGETTEMPSSPVYVPGERVVVFLERERLGGMWRTVGMSQGKITLVEEEDTGRDVVVRVRAPLGTRHFDESQVKLPAYRRYGDDLVARIQQDLDFGFVPAYRKIPGLPPDKDAAFRAAALASGQTLDPRWFSDSSQGAR